MSMTKKHYVAVAKAINEVLWKHESDPATVVMVAAALSDVFRSDNPVRYDGQRFLAACLQGDGDTVSQPGWDTYKAERARLGL